MKKWKRHITAAVIGTLGAVCCANAQDSTSTTTTTTTTQQTTASDNDQPEHDLYRANELSLDLFGLGSIDQTTINDLTGVTAKRDSRIGAGAGVNYFFTRNIGLGADAYTAEPWEHAVVSASGNLILRLPLGESGIAPYVFGGGGEQFEGINQGFGQAGGGVELRIFHELGFFVDARYVFADKTENYGLGRAGLRLTF